MKDKTTCFKLNRYNCDLDCAEDFAQQEITVYRRDNYMAIKELNEYGVICSCKTIHIEKEKVDSFFNFLEEISEEWESNCKAAVCEGSSWKIRIWYSCHKMKTICGGIKYPPYGEKLEKYIRLFLSGDEVLTQP